MQQLWTARGIKGAKYLAAGVFFILGKDPALALAQGNHLAMAGVHVFFGVVGPILAVAGLYLLGTRNKQAKK